MDANKSFISQEAKKEHDESVIREKQVSTFYGEIGLGTFKGKLKTTLKNILMIFLMGLLVGFLSNYIAAYFAIAIMYITGFFIGGFLDFSLYNISFLIVIYFIYVFSIKILKGWFSEKKYFIIYTVIWLSSIVILQLFNVYSR